MALQSIITLVRRPRIKSEERPSRMSARPRLSNYFMYNKLNKNYVVFTCINTTLKRSSSRCEPMFSKEEIIFFLK